MSQSVYLYFALCTYYIYERVMQCPCAIHYTLFGLLCGVYYYSCMLAYCFISQATVGMLKRALNIGRNSTIAPHVIVYLIIVYLDHNLVVVL